MIADGSQADNFPTSIMSLQFYIDGNENSTEMKLLRILGDNHLSRWTSVDVMFLWLSLLGL